MFRKFCSEDNQEKETLPIEDDESSTEIFINILRIATMMSTMVWRGILTMSHLQIKIRIYKYILDGSRQLSNQFGMNPELIKSVDSFVRGKEFDREEERKG